MKVTGYIPLYEGKTKRIHEATGKPHLILSDSDEVFLIGLDPWRFLHLGMSIEGPYEARTVNGHRLMKYRPSFTYGQLPPKAQYRMLYRLHLRDGLYRLGNFHGHEADLIGGSDVELDEDELWALLQKLTKRFHRGDDEAGDLASSILSTLGIEWV